MASEFNFKLNKLNKESQEEKYHSLIALYPDISNTNHDNPIHSVYNKDELRQAGVEYSEFKEEFKKKYDRLFQVSYYRSSEFLSLDESLPFVNRFFKLYSKITDILGVNQYAKSCDQYLQDNKERVADKIVDRATIKAIVKFGPQYDNDTMPIIKSNVGVVQYEALYPTLLTNLHAIHWLKEFWPLKALIETYLNTNPNPLWSRFNVKIFKNLRSFVNATYGMTFGNIVTDYGMLEVSNTYQNKISLLFDFLDKNGMNLQYFDTDEIFFTMKDFTINKDERKALLYSGAQKIVDYILTSQGLNTSMQSFTPFSRVTFLAKKSFVAVGADKDELMVKGMGQNGRHWKPSNS